MNVKDDATTHVLLCDLDVVVVGLPAVHGDRVVLSPFVLLTVGIEQVSWGADEFCRGHFILFDVT